jgi:hypothetical protein
MGSEVFQEGDKTRRADSPFVGTFFVETFSITTAFFDPKVFERCMGALG